MPTNPRLGTSLTGHHLIPLKLDPSAHSIMAPPGKKPSFIPRPVGKIRKTAAKSSKAKTGFMSLPRELRTKVYEESHANTTHPTARTIANFGNSRTGSQHLQVTFRHQLFTGNGDPVLISSDDLVCSGHLKPAGDSFTTLGPAVNLLSNLGRTNKALHAEIDSLLYGKTILSIVL